MEDQKVMAEDQEVVREDQGGELEGCNDEESRGHGSHSGRSNIF
ncbi:12571_t:CDS:2 [Funneliformis caledonium]|uniref:12571_t:CDS:1 n=1 Tax=Funneliformis caledonium TaxID=1117310 RepID=A0A9N9IS54_9GLOM|nr:12571_t:CDS:2 [Funneliformis caledonium]